MTPQDQIYHSRTLQALTEIEPPPYLVDGFLRRETLTLFTSGPYTGKTMLMLDLMLSMEGSLKYLETFDIVSPSSCLYIGLDSPKWDLSGQLKKLALGHELGPDKLSMFDSRVIGRRDSKIKITDPALPDYLRWLKETYTIDVLFIDTIRRFHDGNENDSLEMGQMMERLEGLVDDHHFTIIMSTHTAKPTGTDRSINYSARGSTVIPGSVDFHYHLSRNRKGQLILNGSGKRRGESHGEGSLLLEFKDLPGPALRILPVDDTVPPTSGGADVLEVLASGPKTAPELVAATGQSYWKVQKELAHLLANHRVQRVSRGTWALS